MDAIRSFIQEIQATLLDVSGSVALIGLLGLAFMYLGSSVPFLSTWKQDHPKAFDDVAVGLFILIVTTGGGVAALIGHH